MSLLFWSSIVGIIYVGYIFYRVFYVRNTLKEEFTIFGKEEQADDTISQTDLDKRINGVTGDISKYKKLQTTISNDDSKKWMKYIAHLGDWTKNRMQLLTEKMMTASKEKQDDIMNEMYRHDKFLNSLDTVFTHIEDNS